MPTIIDTLTVNLELNSDQFKKGVAEVENVLKRIEAMLKPIAADAERFARALQKAGTEAQKPQAAVEKLTTSVKGVGGAADDAGQKASGMGSMLQGASSGGAAGLLKMAGVAGLAAGAVMEIVNSAKQLIVQLNEMIGLGAIKDWLFNAAEDANNLWRTADGLKVNIRELKTWQLTVREFGGTAEGFNNSLHQMQARFGVLGTQMRGAKMVSQVLGIAGISEDTVKINNALDVLKVFAAHMDKMSTGQQQAVAKRLGIDDHLLEVLRQSGPLLKDFLAENDKLVPSAAALEKRAVTAMQWEQITMQWEAARAELADALVPIMQELLGLLNDMVTWIHENPEEAKNIFYGLVIAVTALTVAMGLLAIVAGVIVVAVLGPMVAAGYAAFKAFGVFREGVDNLSDSFARLYNAARPFLSIIPGLSNLPPLPEVVRRGPNAAMDRVPVFSSEAMMSLGAVNRGLGTAAPAAQHKMDVHFGTVNVHAAPGVDGATLASDFTKGVVDNFRRSGLVTMASGSTR